MLPEMRRALSALLVLSGLAACCPLGYHVDASGSCVENNRDRAPPHRDDGGKDDGRRLAATPALCRRAAPPQGPAPRRAPPTS